MKGLRCTPGPWEVLYKYDEPEGYFGPQVTTIFLRLGERVLELASAGDKRCAHFQTWDANARLIAAAPDLLEALEAVVKAWLHEAAQGDGIMEEHAPILTKARAVIAEAKGEAP